MTSRQELGASPRAETMKWTVEQVQSTQDDRFAGSSFNICNRHGAPIITFGYVTDRQAREAREQIVAALSAARFVG
jgi:hypothetical protein